MNSPASSMQLTRGADYAVRIMIHLAGLPGNERLLLPALAAVAGAPPSFLSKVLQALTRAGLIASRRGQQGGFEILPSGREASVLDVVEAIDGPIRLNVCLQHGASCTRKTWCPAHPVWQKAQTAMIDVLRTAKVASLSPVSINIEPAR
ncbi:MAG: Rrf2 family transcriptional regulator [Terracidiphilus sp.]|nr:Rrf2 family transcriptional regulator [Terracidiphilus sp.]